MTDDFDWTGETIDDGEGENVPIVLVPEPSGNQGTGIDAPGLLSATTDFVSFGVYNGNFRRGPPDPAQNLDVATSQAGSNFMPGWRFIQSSNTNITASQVRDTSSPSGSNLRFTFAAGAAADEAYAEQIIDIGGDRSFGVGHIIRVTPRGSSGSANFAALVRAQYLTTDGTITGMPSEAQSTITVPAGGELSFFGVKVWRTDTPTPGAARYIRLRIGVRRGAAATSATGSIDFSDVRVDKAAQQVIFSDLAQGVGPHYIFQSGHRLYQNNLGDTALRELSGKLVGIDFTYVNLPDGATTQLIPSDFALGFGTPRVRVPWGGSIVGLSYRISAAVPATETLDIEATVAGAGVWTAHSLTSASAQVGAASQAPGTDTYATANQLGVQATTSVGFGATHEIHCTLWLLVDYDGT